MMEEVRTSETFFKLVADGLVTQKKIIFVLTAASTSNLTVFY